MPRINGAENGLLGPKIDIIGPIGLFLWLSIASVVSTVAGEANER